MSGAVSERQSRKYQYTQLCKSDQMALSIVSRGRKPDGVKQLGKYHEKYGIWILQEKEICIEVEIWNEIHFYTKHVEKCR